MDRFNSPVFSTPVDNFSEGGSRAVSIEIFQKTLDGFLEKYQPNNQIVIHNDSDLYSSSLYLLTRTHDIIKKNTIIIFDEFSNVMHEFQALEDYCSAYQRTYNVIASTKDYYQRVAIQFDN